MKIKHEPKTHTNTRHTHQHITHTHTHTHTYTHAHTHKGCDYIAKAWQCCFRVRREDRLEAQGSRHDFNKSRNAQSTYAKLLHPPSLSLSPSLPPSLSP